MESIDLLRESGWHGPRCGVYGLGAGAICAGISVHSRRTAEAERTAVDARTVQANSFIGTPLGSTRGAFLTSYFRNNVLAEIPHRFGAISIYCQ
jgi:hypothetical protein